MTRKRLLMGNWKMYKTVAETRRFVEDLQGLTQKTPLPAQVETVICPPFTAIGELVRWVNASSQPIGVGAQNVHFAAQGAFTGEISADMLADLGVKYVLVGHSERRTLFGESDEWVQQKAAAVAAQGMQPVICVGENQDERDAQRTLDVVEHQTLTALNGLAASSRGADVVGTAVIAYEPVWAIGSGRTPAPEEAQAVIGAIRQCVARACGAAAADRIRILYGGSVKPENIASFTLQPDIDGALVGGASLQADSFLAMAQAMAGGDA
ncbi:triose-phosphate isomerase [Alicyclobacillus cycloheptanicus]|uniref:Triosephosphate isomerase n=1 Tax=Alicyclobacillus cycloheptanicus TaxID=1457 RepID=A0ABT9XHA9_9BACL|nr:triose-phosphate isomerase [Alicyclobacillus cycloheptanicus]MDQ0189673.1 triosephosphate isomerase [Alicyclobacillus cycloheptanicus]WDL99971.1 triose-phosphate isomerase [Alicyclobacillus cycloheptanicus]